MTLSPEIQEFCQRWLNKADEAIRSRSLSGLFDAFFSHFVAFNRLYGTAFLDLASRGEAPQRDDNCIPDRDAATKYTARYIGPSRLISAIESDPASAEALLQIVSFIREERFHFKLSRRGERLPEEDKKLLGKLTNKTPQSRAKGILEVLYAIRCNMFHGHKGFDEIQEAVLVPSNTLLRKVIKLLLEELRTIHNRPA